MDPLRGANSVGHETRSEITRTSRQPVSYSEDLSNTTAALARASITEKAASALPLRATLTAFFAEHKVGIQQGFMPSFILTIIEQFAGPSPLVKRLLHKARKADAEGQFDLANVSCTRRPAGPQNVLEAIEIFVDNPVFQQDPDAFMSEESSPLDPHPLVGVNFDTYTGKKSFHAFAVIFINMFLEKEKKSCSAN